MGVLLRAEGVGKSYALRGGRIDILRDVDLDFRGGQLTALVGNPGSGTTTLLHILGLLTEPDRGRVLLDGDDMTGLTGTRRADARRTRLGFVSRSGDLLPQHSAARNVLVPYAGSRPAGEARVRALLERLGLAGRAANLPGQLSDGEQRRVALARALVNDPPVVLAEEGQLPHLLRELADEGRAVVVVTRDPAVADAADVVHRLEKGVLVGGREDWAEWVDRTDRAVMG